jgi:hypothetical protein
LFGVVSALVTVSKGDGITTETLWLLIAQKEEKERTTAC